MPFHLQGLDHVAIGVRDQARSIAFYADVLGLERRYEKEWGDSPALMAAAGSGVAIFAAEDARDLTGDASGAISIRHIAFRVDRAGFEEAQTGLAAAGIGTRLADHGVAHSIYFSDPDGHRLELTTYDVDAPRA